MFFKNIENWTKSKLRELNILFGFLHFAFLVLIPVIITSFNYKLFNKVEGHQLTATGVIVVVILGLYAYSKINKSIDKLPQIKMHQQRFKFTLKTILSLLPILIILYALNVAKSDYLVAINVIKWCSVSFAGAIIVDGFFLKYIEQELDTRNKALELVEVEKRKRLV